MKLKQALNVVARLVDKTAQRAELYYQQLALNWSAHEADDSGGGDHESDDGDYPLLSHDAVPWTHYHVEESNTNYAVAFMHTGRCFDVVQAYADDPTDDVFAFTLTGAVPMTQYCGREYNNILPISRDQECYDDKRFIVKRQSDDANGWPDGWIPFTGGRFISSSSMELYCASVFTSLVLRQERFIGITTPGCVDPISSFTGLASVLQDGQLHSSLVVNADNNEYLIQNPRTREWQNICPAFRYGSDNDGDNTYGPIWGLIYAGDTIVMNDNASRLIFKAIEPMIVVFPGVNQFDEVLHGLLVYPFAQRVSDASSQEASTLLMIVNTGNKTLAKKTYGLSPYTQYYGGSHHSKGATYSHHFTVVNATVTGESATGYKVTRGNNSLIDNFS